MAEQTELTELTEQTEMTAIIVSTKIWKSITHLLTHSVTTWKQEMLAHLKIMGEKKNKIPTLLAEPAWLWDFLRYELEKGLRLSHFLTTFLDYFTF